MRPWLGWLWEKIMQVNRDIAYRLAFETASQELYLIQGAMKKLQQERDRAENDILSRSPLAAFEQRGGTLAAEGNAVGTAGGRRVSRDLSGDDVGCHQSVRAV